MLVYMDKLNKSAKNTVTQRQELGDLMAALKARDQWAGKELHWSKDFEPDIYKMETEWKAAFVLGFHSSCNNSSGL